MSMLSNQWPSSLFYRDKWRKAEAERLAAQMENAGRVKFREARHFHGAEDCEFKLAKVNVPRVNYDRVFVLAGSSNAQTIVDEYAEWGVEVEVVSEKAPPQSEPPAASGAPEKPDYRKMKKAELRQAAIDIYGQNLPLEMKVAELREWLGGQPWPPVVAPVENELPEDEL